MVIQRKIPRDTAPQDLGPDIVDHLVRKSLEINGALRKNRSTAEVMADIKKQAQQASKEKAQVSAKPAPQASAAARPPAAAVTSSPGLSVTSKRNAAVSYFMEQKATDYQRQLEELRAQEAELARKRKQLEQETMTSIVDFLTVVTLGASPAEAQSALAGVQPHLRALGTSDAQLLQMLRT